MDYSSQMLAILKQQAENEKLVNIEAVEAAWEDNWQEIGIKPHEAVIASRSLAVDDLAAALAKISQWARKAVFVADRVGATPFDPEAFAAVGREFSPGPDYIYTVNYSINSASTPRWILSTCLKSQSWPAAKMHLPHTPGYLTG